MSLAQLVENLLCRHTSVRGKNKIGLRIREGEAELRQLLFRLLPRLHDHIPRPVKVRAILHRRRAGENSRTVHRIGIEGIADIFQTLDERLVADGITETHTGE